MTQFAAPDIERSAAAAVGATTGTTCALMYRDAVKGKRRLTSSVLVDGSSSCSGWPSSSR